MSGDRKLGVLGLAVLSFYAVSGGPFGIEQTVQAGGPLFALLGFSTLLVWALPEALVTAELSTALPEAAGSVAWVETAFGPFWGFMKGYLSYCSGVLDNSLYPILFLDCLLQLVDDDQESILDNSRVRMLFVTVITVILSYLNYRGLDIVGNVALVLCTLSMLPFLIMILIASFHLKPERWLQGPEGGIKEVDWGLLLNTFFWNINFWESAACFSGDVKDPGRTFPRGILLAVLLVALSSFLSILFCTGASNSPYADWTDGFFVHIADELGGPWLSGWMMFAASITNIGLFEAEMSSDSLQIAGMADRAILPKFLSYRTQYGTPLYGIFMSAACVILFSGYDFSELVQMLNLLFCMGQAIEFVAFLHLRYYRMDLHRPYMIPLNFIGCVLLLLPPFVFMGIIMYFSLLQSLLLCSALALFGVGLHYMLVFIKNNKWLEFELRIVRPEDSSECDEATEEDEPAPMGNKATKRISANGDSYAYKALAVDDSEGPGLNNKI